MKKIYTDEQIVGFMREAAKSEATIAEFCRQKGFNEGTFYKWISSTANLRSHQIFPLTFSTIANLCSPLRIENFSE